MGGYIQERIYESRKMEYEESIRKKGGPVRFVADRLAVLAAYCINDIRYNGMTDFAHHLQGELQLTNAPTGSYVVKELLKLMNEQEEQMLWQHVFGTLLVDCHLKTPCIELLASLPNAPKSLVKLVENAKEQNCPVGTCTYKESPLLIAITTVVQRINSVMQVEKWKRGIKQRQTKIDDYVEKKSSVASEELIQAPPPSPEMTDGAHRKRGRKPARAEEPAKVEDAGEPTKCQEEPAKPSAMQVEMGMKPATEEKRPRGRPRKTKLDAPTK